jgi:hypothetical protein
VNHRVSDNTQLAITGAIFVVYLCIFCVLWVDKGLPGWGL